MAARSGDFSFEVVEGWGQGAGGRVFGGVTPAVATDSQDRVYIARRDPPAILVYDREGNFLSTLGEDLFKNPHSVWFNEQDQMYVADVDDHTVRKLDTEGNVLLTLGTADAVGAPGQPFNGPTWAVEASWGRYLRIGRLRTVLRAPLFCGRDVAAVVGRGGHGAGAVRVAAWHPGGQPRGECWC